MTQPFRRGVSKRLLDDLLGGPCATVFDACMKAGLDAHLRPGYVNLYFKGRSMARIVGRSRLPAKLEIHPKYVNGGRIGRFTGRPSGNNLNFDVDADFAQAYANQLPTLIERARGHVGREESVESDLLRHNGELADVCCFDRQINCRAYAESSTSLA